MTLRSLCRLASLAVAPLAWIACGVVGAPGSKADECLNGTSGTPANNYCNCPNGYTPGQPPEVQACKGSCLELAGLPACVPLTDPTCHTCTLTGTGGRSGTGGAGGRGGTGGTTDPNQCIPSAACQMILSPVSALQLPEGGFHVIGATSGESFGLLAGEPITVTFTIADESSVMTPAVPSTPVNLQPRLRVHNVDAIGDTSHDILKTYTVPALKACICTSESISLPNGLTLGSEEDSATYEFTLEGLTFNGPIAQKVVTRGDSSGTGGAVGTGGATGAGGDPGTGGITGTGGTTGAGGTTGTGGTIGTGGDPGNGEIGL